MKTFSRMRMWASCLLAAGLFFVFTSCANGSGGDSGSVAVTSVELNKTSTSITVGGTETLTATVKPDNATDKSVTWTSSNTDVASVDKGVVTAVAVGEATIMAKAGDKTATCAVTVTVPKIVDLSTLTEDTVVADGYTITGTLAAAVKVSIANGAKVTLKGASINAEGTWTSGDYAGLNCLGDATITLEAGTTNTVKGFKMTYPGIHVPSGKTLTINGTGALTVSPNTSGAGQNATGAGIGGGVGLPCGNIVIAGGTITASTANDAAAIGSGGSGGGSDQTCGNISITGGTVTATCSVQHGPGIGAGRRGSCGDISITGGTVTATGASTGSCGAGIGCGGSNSTVGTITIASTVTKVTATAGVSGNWRAKSIGKGYDSSTCVCGTITIGGKVYADGIATSPYTYPKLVDLSTVTGNTTVEDGYTITGTLAGNYMISIDADATVTLKNVDMTVGSGIVCAGNATITLAADSTNVIKGLYDKAGIYVPKESTLIINGTGSLDVTASNDGAGIGGGWGKEVGNIEIQSGNITARGGVKGAGIGGGEIGKCGNITISGGNVTAIGGENGAGIGGGKLTSNNQSVCGNIVISGGTVIATGGSGAAGIGGGCGNNVNYKSSCGTITIASTVTSVTATKGSGAPYSIGAGSNGTCGAVTIGGDSTTYAAGISGSPYTYQPSN